MDPTERPVRNSRPLTRHEFLVRSLFAGAVAVPMGGLLAGCGGDSSSEDGSPATRPADPPTSPTGTLVYALAAAPVTLDAARRSISGDFTVTQPIYDTLVRWNEDFTDVEPGLVTKYTVSADGREWVGNIREGVTFHDGASLDSTAVRMGIEYYRDAEGYLGPFFLPQFSEIDDSDPAVIRFVTKNAAPDLTRNLTTVGIMSPRSVRRGNKAIEREPAGTGAFRFADRSGTTVTLEANPDYWEKGKPYLERVRFQVLGDLGARVSALQSGQVNVIDRVPSTQARQLERASGVKLVASDLWTVSYLAIKMLTSPTDELKVRQAVGYGIDRQAIADSILKGQAEPADSYMPEGIYGYQPMDPLYQYDLERAKSLLEEVGDPSALSLRMATVAGDNAINNPQIAQAFAAQLEELGLSVSVEPLEEGLFNQQADKPQPRNQVFTIDHPWSNGGPFIFDFLTFSTVVNLPEAEPEIAKRAAELTTQVQTTPDGDKRVELIGELQNLYAEQAGYLPMFFWKVPDAVSDNVEGYAVPKDGLGNYRLGSVYLT